MKILQMIVQKYLDKIIVYFINKQIRFISMHICFHGYELKYLSFWGGVYV